MLNQIAYQRFLREWGGGSLECGVWSLEWGVGSLEWGVWSVECGVWKWGVGEWGVGGSAGWGDCLTNKVTYLLTNKVTYLFNPIKSIYFILILFRNLLRKILNLSLGFSSGMGVVLDLFA